ncbi:MAG: 2-amino-4-hydroxy-6-hydroxymethyldihydropteridine diphosphokinase [Endomicrobia bacterium]|nr:2-amino-4-hydroxy-6-hydroxymethyldihydropteridine diphosphokinase [Endomicrobiia bacterium]
MTTTYISLGTNLGCKYKNILNAISYLTMIGKIKNISSVYLSSPVENINQPYFYNCVIKFNTKLSPLELLQALKYIEKKLGRKNTKKRYLPRIIDLDILFYGKKIIHHKKLTIPHKKLHQRKFVLWPLNELAGGFIHPVFHKRINTLKRMLTDDTQKIKLVFYSKKLLKDVNKQIMLNSYY